MAAQRPVLLVGGKGGVGKTTCSAAIAARLAELGQRTLLITSDQTPSLSDVLLQPVGDQVRAMAPGLDAVEVSQAAIAARWKQKFGPDFYEVLSHLLDVEALDARSQHQLIDYIGSAPSLREETMLDIIMELATGRGYQRVVWDTAPAGETLNLLAMPKKIREHLRAGAKVYEGLDRLGKRVTGGRSIAGIMETWTALSEVLGQFLRERAACVLVTAPEALVVNQTRRLVATLAEYQLALVGLVVNRVVDRADSPLLASLQQSQAAYLGELRDIAGELPLAVLPFSYVELRGAPKLAEVGRGLVDALSLA